MRVLLAAAAAVALALPAAPVLARELYPDQYAQIDRATRDWFRAQKSPATGALCCSEADGTYAEEDMRDGHYWTRFMIRDEQVDWMQVPDEVVIHGPNRNGAAVIWFWFDNGVPKIRCFAPGGGV